MDKLAIMELNSTEVEIIDFSLSVLQDAAAAITKVGEVDNMMIVTGLLRERLSALSEKLDE